MGVSMPGVVSIKATEVTAPPAWALMERQLIDLMNEAAPLVVEKYTERGGALYYKDALDDLYERVYNWGLFYAMGGDEKILDLVGVGYRVQQSGKGITLSVMLSHSVDVDPPEGVTLEVEGNNRIFVRGIDKQAVGQIAAEIRSVRPPNAYTGKGIRYSDEQVRIKPGKSARRAEI